MPAATTTTPLPASPGGEEHATEDTLEEILKQVGANGEALGLSMDLLRRIIELLLPKAAGDGPTLTELLAAVLATMRELLIVERSNAKGIDEILSRLDTMPVTGRIALSPRTNGAHG